MLEKFALARTMQEFFTTIDEIDAARNRRRSVMRHHHIELARRSGGAHQGRA